MKEVNFILFAFALVGIAIFAAVAIVENSDFDAERYFLSERALTADYHLAVARGELVHGQFDRCVRESEKAIRELEFVKSVTDSEGISLVENSIVHLTQVVDELKTGEMVLESLVEVSLESLNTLALVHLKLANQFIEEGEQEKATKSVQIAIEHLQNAMTMASLHSQRDKEKMLIDEMNLLFADLQQNGRIEESAYRHAINGLTELLRKN